MLPLASAAKPVALLLVLALPATLWMPAGHGPVTPVRSSSASAAEVTSQVASQVATGVVLVRRAAAPVLM